MRRVCCELVYTRLLHDGWFFFFFKQARVDPRVLSEISACFEVLCFLPKKDIYHILITILYLHDRRIPWFQDRILYNPTLIRQMRTSKCSLANLKADIYISFLLPYIKHYLGIVVGCFLERLQNRSKYRKIVTLIIILDYVKVSRYNSTIL